MQSAIRLTVAVAVSAACFVIATQGTDWGRVWEALRQADLSWVVAVMVVSSISHVLRAERWRVLLRPVAAVPRLPPIAATFIGFGASSVLPLRLGEIVRPALLARRIGIDLSPALSSVVLERLFDILLVICCFLVVGLFYPVDANLRTGALFLGVLVAVGLLVLVQMQRHRAASERLLRRVLELLPSRVFRVVWPLVDGLFRGLGGLADVRTVLSVLAYSVTLWGAITLTYLLSFLALDITVPLLQASLVTVVIVAVFVFLPQAPGFIGTWQLGCVTALTLFDVPRELALSYAFLTWIVQMIVNVGGAGLFIAFEDGSIRDLVRSPRAEKAEA